MTQPPNDQEIPAIPPSSMNRPRRSTLLVLLGWGTALTFGLVALVTVVLLIENIRGQRAWKRFRAEWEAKGENFEVKALLPPPIPAEENFALTPLLAPLLDYEGRPVRWNDPAGKEKATALANPFKGMSSRKMPPAGSWELAVPTDLPAWAAFFRGNADGDKPKAAEAAESVILALGRFQPELEEIRRASVRPAVFPIHYQDGFNALLPHLAVLKGLESIVSLRAVAQLAVGHTNDSFADVLLSIRLTEALKNEPFLVSQLVRLGMLRSALQPIWEGIDRREWQESQLADLQYLLSGLNILDSYGRSLRGERAFAVLMLDQLRSGISDWRNFDNGEQPLVRFRQVLPAGFFNQNQLTICQAYQNYLLPIVDAEKRRVYPNKAAESENLPEYQRRTPYNIFASLLIPAVHKAGIKFAWGQTSVDLALTSCALERFRLAHGHYPAKLDELTPAFMTKLPTDVISGESLGYHATSDGRYVLYSLGWNAVDDGGMPGRVGKGKGNDLTHGDWVWAFSTR